MVETFSQVEDVEIKDVEYNLIVSYPIELVYDQKEGVG